MKTLALSIGMAGVALAQLPEFSTLALVVDRAEKPDGNY